MSPRWLDSQIQILFVKSIQSWGHLIAQEPEAAFILLAPRSTTPAQPPAVISWSGRTSGFARRTAGGPAMRQNANSTIVEPFRVKLWLVFNLKKFFFDSNERSNLQSLKILEV